MTNPITTLREIHEKAEKAGMYEDGIITQAYLTAIVTEHNMFKVLMDLLEACKRNVRDKYNLPVCCICSRYISYGERVMAQAFDEKGTPLGPEIIRDTRSEAFQAVLKEHMDPAEIRVRALHESVEQMEANTALQLVKDIDAKLGVGWCEELAKALT